MTDDVRDPTAGAGGSDPGPMPLSTRVSAALALLESPSRSEYESLTTAEQVHIQEAIEHLRRVNAGFRGGDRRE